MNQEIKKRWVEELRSGKHVQGRGQLRDHEGRVCALGVLCEMAIEDGVQIERRHDHYESMPSGECFEVCPPVEVVRWADLTPRISGLVASRNDDGYSLAELASLIEKSTW